MASDNDDSSRPPAATAGPTGGSDARGRRWLRALGFLLLTVALTTAATVWIVKTYIFPSEFRPVHLSAAEERVLDDKLDRFESITLASDKPAASRSGRTSAEPRRREPAAKLPPLEPEPYRELDADREILLSEREVNALLARNTDLARKVAIDLSEGLVSAKILVPFDPDFPVLGGRIIRVNAGLELAFAHERPVVVLKGVSIMGVPVPSAWLGGLKNVDLVERFGGDKGFWRAFAAGVAALEVRDGELRVRLKE
jgi:hypothetical protein